MRPLSHRNEIKLGLIVSLIMAIIAGIVIYDRRPVAPEEYAVYEAAIRPDHIVFYETAEGIDLDPELAARAGLALASGPGWGSQVSRVTFADDGTRASVRVGNSVCGPDHGYIVEYGLFKDSAGWHKVSEELVREVFC